LTKNKGVVERNYNLELGRLCDYIISCYAKLGRYKSPFDDNKKAERGRMVVVVDVEMRVKLGVKERTGVK